MLIIFDAHKIQNNVVRCYSHVSRHTLPGTRPRVRCVNVHRFDVCTQRCEIGEGRVEGWYSKSGTLARVYRVPAPPTVIYYDMQRVWYRKICIGRTWKSWMSFEQHMTVVGSMKVFLIFSVFRVSPVFLTRKSSGNPRGKYNDCQSKFVKNTLDRTG